MSLLGKILAFLNILGAAAFVSLAAMDFAKRQAWKYAVDRHDLLNNGLPVTRLEKNKAGEVIADNMGELTLRELGLGTFNGQPVVTQTEEVQRVRQELQKTLQDVAQDKRKQLVQYAMYLRPLAGTNAERERLISLLFYLSKDEPADKLKKDLERSLRPALEIMRADPAKRPFEEAYAEAVQRLGGDPRDPFVKALLKVLPREGQTFAQAFADAIKNEKPMGDGAGVKGSVQELFLQALRRDPAKPFAELFAAAYDDALEAERADLQKRFDLLFEEALQPAKGPQDKVVGQTFGDHEKQRIAHLLFNLAEVMPRPAPAAGQQPPASIIDDDIYKRFINVVGLRTAGKVIDRRAQELQRITVELSASMTREQAAFVLAHQDLLNHIRDRAGHVDVQDALRLRKKDMADEKEKIIVRRKVDIDYFNKELAEARKETADRLKELREMSKELYNIRIETRQDTEKNQAYEKDLGRLEDRIR